MEFMEEDPSNLTPTQESSINVSNDQADSSLNLINDSEILNIMITTLIKAYPKNYDSLPYHEKVKLETIKS